MQGVTRNPLADPGILGVNTGAALAVSIGIAWFGMWSYTSYIWTAIAGAAVTAVFVYAIGSLGRGGPTPLKLALAGAAASVALASFISAVVLGRNDIASTLRSWQVGGVGGGSWDAIGQVLPVDWLAPHFARVVFTAPEFARVGRGGPDQRFKLVLPLPGVPFEAFPTGADWYDQWRRLPDEMRHPIRTYTIRDVDPARQQLVVDFVAHGDEGPASRWVQRAAAGDRVLVIAPEGTPSRRMGMAPGRRDDAADRRG